MRAPSLPSRTRSLDRTLAVQSRLLRLGRLRLSLLCVVCVLAGVAIASFVAAVAPGTPPPSYLYDDFQSNSIHSGDWYESDSYGDLSVSNAMLHLRGRDIAIERSFRMDRSETAAIVRIRPWRAAIMGVSLKSWDGKSLSVELDPGGIKCGRSTKTDWQPTTFVPWPQRRYAPWFSGRWFTLELALQQHPFQVSCLAYDSNGLLIGRWTYRHLAFQYSDLSLLAVGMMKGAARYDIASVYAGPPSGAPGIHLSQAPPRLIAASPVAADGTITLSGSGQPHERVDILDNGAGVGQTTVTGQGAFAVTITTAIGVNALQADEYTVNIQRAWKSNVLTVTR